MTLIHDDFMLRNETSRLLYHKYAEHMPIFDYHSHLDAVDLLEDRSYNNLTDIWLRQDHYKWRLMRAAGIAEEAVTGAGEDYEKFLSWAEVLEKCIGNPIYHWIHLELKRYFGIDELLNKKTAPMIWERSCSLLEGADYRAVSLLKRSGVKGVCTTDDPTDKLDAHIRIREKQDRELQVIPTFRPDRAWNLRGEEYRKWLGELERVSGVSIGSYEDLEGALSRRCLSFKAAGCLSGDQAILYPDFSKRDRKLAAAVFQKLKNGENVNPSDIFVYQTELMLFLAGLYHDNDMVMQLHLGAARNVNERMFRQLGPDSGYDTMGEQINVQLAAPLFSTLDSCGRLPRTILFSSNPNDYEKLVAFSNCFNSGGVPGKVQLGAAWWFADHKDGIESQLRIIARQSVLRSFAGMLTDSRSILSQSRHEYFRRVLCSLLGRWAEDGEIPVDEELLGGLVRDVCYHNAVGYFKFQETGTAF